MDVDKEMARFDKMFGEFEPYVLAAAMDGGLYVEEHLKGGELEAGPFDHEGPNGLPFYRIWWARSFGVADDVLKRADELIDFGLCVFEDEKGGVYIGVDGTMYREDLAKVIGILYN